MQPWKQRWVFSGSYRFYTQNSANFFSDLFPAIDAQNFMARDRPYSRSPPIPSVSAPRMNFR